MQLYRDTLCSHVIIILMRNLLRSSQWHTKPFTQIPSHTIRFLCTRPQWKRKPLLSRTVSTDCLIPRQLRNCFAIVILPRQNSKSRERVLLSFTISYFPVFPTSSSNSSAVFQLKLRYLFLRNSTLARRIFLRNQCRINEKQVIKINILRHSVSN